jgi:hypothetical protein
MLSIRTLALAALLACVVPAAIAQTQPAIERQMTPAEFKAAGLDRLSADELAHLNAWLGRTLDIETSKATAVAKKKVEDDNRGFFNFGSQTAISSRISGEFGGLAMGRTYSLENGQVWKQIESESLAGVRLSNPEVTIKPGMVGNVWYLQIKGYNTRAKVQRVK